MKPKVFGIGLPRTGSTSLAEAMRLLDYNSLHTPIGIHHFMEYDFTADPLTVMNYKFLDALFPDAKFILTIRDVQSWLNSNKIYCTDVVDRMHGGNVPVEVAEQRFALFGTTTFNTDKFIIAYHKHLVDVLEYFEDKKDKLLIMNVCGGQGWDVLCPFLGIDTPCIEFPDLGKLQKVDDIYMLSNFIDYDAPPMSDKGIIVNILHKADNERLELSEKVEKELRNQLAKIDKEFEYKEVQFC